MTRIIDRLLYGACRYVPGSVLFRIICVEQKGGLDALLVVGQRGGLKVCVDRVKLGRSARSIIDSNA
jgi:hypothetical protein